MACAHPLVLKYKDYGHIQVPCGQCINCRVHKSSVWSDRIRFEVQDGFKNSCFVTLTYNDDNLPFCFDEDDVVRSTLCPKHLQDFLKRLRYHVSKYTDSKLKFFACGEYGGRFGRPHYHIFIIGLLRSKSIVDLLNSCWNMGQIDVQAPRDIEDCVRYVTGYIIKKYTGKQSQDLYGAAYPPFQRSSLKLGLDFYKKHVDHILKNDGMFIRGKVHSLPKSILNKPEFQTLAQKLKSRFFLEQFAHADPDVEDRDLQKALKRESELKTLSLRS